MFNDQENYDTFEYDKPEQALYEPITDSIVAPNVNAPPLPPARNKFKHGVQKKPLALPKTSKMDIKSSTLPRLNQTNNSLIRNLAPPPQMPDCDENYEEFPCEEIKIPDGDENYEEFPSKEIKMPDCDENYEEFPSKEIKLNIQDENYECMDTEAMENHITPPKKLFQPEWKSPQEKPRPETKLPPPKSTPSPSISACGLTLSDVLSARDNLKKPGATQKERPIATDSPSQSEINFKRPELTKPKEKPQPAPKSSLVNEISKQFQQMHLLSKESTSTVNRKKSISSDHSASDRDSYENKPVPQPRQPQQQQQPRQPQQQKPQQKPPQKPQQEEEEISDEDDPREVYADACDARLFLQDKPWYFGKLKRKSEERLLRDIDQNGAFLVRDCSNPSVAQPFTLTVYSNGHFFRLKIRLLDSGKFVVGEKKDSEIEFRTIQDLITYYQNEPLLLLASFNNTNSCTTLNCSPDKNKL